MTKAQAQNLTITDIKPSSSRQNNSKMNSSDSVPSLNMNSSRLNKISGPARPEGRCGSLKIAKRYRLKYYSIYKYIKIRPPPNKVAQKTSIIVQVTGAVQLTQTDLICSVFKQRHDLSVSAFLDSFTTRSSLRSSLTSRDEARLSDWPRTDDKSVTHPRRRR